MWFIKATTNSWHIGRVPFGRYYLTFIAAVGAVIFSVILLMGVPGSFIPPDDSSRITVSVELPPGSTLDDTDRTTKVIVDKIKDIPYIENIFILGGASPDRRSGRPPRLDHGQP